jgi:hypothetical protein
MPSEIITEETVLSKMEVSLTFDQKNVRNAAMGCHKFKD